VPASQQKQGRADSQDHRCQLQQHAPPAAAEGQSSAHEEETAGHADGPAALVLETNAWVTEDEEQRCHD
jgi:hypothetical protein